MAPPSGRSRAPAIARLAPFLLGFLLLSAPIYQAGVFKVAQATRIKICGITRVEDALLAAEQGADAIGIVFYPPSPRHVDDLERARAIAMAAGPLVTVVGLFVDPDPSDVHGVLERVPLHIMQFHGNETDAFCQQFGRPYMKALRMKPDVDIAGQAASFVGASGVLLDAYRKGVPGGTGETFDWASIPKAIKQPIVLAGGLNPDNVSDAIRVAKPWAVDVSGGVEAAKGIKDAELVARFCQRVREASAN